MIYDVEIDPTNSEQIMLTDDCGYSNTRYLDCRFIIVIEEEEVMNKNNKSEGIFTKQMMKQMGIERIIFNDEATIVFLKNGNKGVAVQGTRDEADRLIGLSVAYAIAVGTDGNKSQFRKNIIQLEKHDGFGN
jgi:hypothetical protein